MQRLTASFLSLLMFVGSFVPRNDLGELAKLPGLVQHYRYHHSAAGGGLSVGQFLAEHYGADEPRHFGDTFAAWHHHDHHSLPLHDVRPSNWVGFVLTQPVRVGQPAASVWAKPTFKAACASQYQFGLGAGLLQPPRA